MGNDFTHEELLLILSAVRTVYQMMNDPEPFKVIDSKLKSMIVDYCEHEGEIGKDYPAEKCMKCHKMWE
jgi:hypothetical protein